jgi:UDP-N-acetylmuramate--alanine ligase
MVSDVFAPRTRVHIVGIGGAGMSGLARLLSGAGVDVSGCDEHPSNVLSSLADEGVRISLGHDASHLEGVDVVTWSPAIGPGNVELYAGRQVGATMLGRSSVLAALARMRQVIGLTGTHGKTTSTSMMVHVMAAAGRDCARLLGANVIGVGANGAWGSGDLVLEVDESYGTFAELVPFALGLLNVEADHLDHYGTLDALDAAFVDLLERTTGPVVAWTDDPGASRVAARATREVLRVGTDGSATWRVVDANTSRRRAGFTLHGPDRVLDVELRVAGLHNVANAAVVAALALSVGVDEAAVVRGLAAFEGAPRRFEFLGSWRGVDVYEDYAHLPGEIAATLAATRAAGYEHITVVFQPHRVTRTVALAPTFAPAFDDAKTVIVTDIYRAGEANPNGVTGEIIADEVLRRARVETRYCPELSDVPDELESLSDVGDVIVLLGAGDVATLAQSLEGMRS